MPNCKECSREIKSRYPSQAKLRTYCSMECSVIGVHKVQQNRVEKRCLNCGKVFFIKASKGDKRFTCSQVCVDKLRAKKGAKSHFADGSVVYKKKKFDPIHRIIMGQYLGRKIRKNEVVHHKNGNNLDNRIENLELMTKSEHQKHHKTIRFDKPNY